MSFCPNVIWLKVVPSGGKLRAGNVRAPIDVTKRG